MAIAVNMEKIRERIPRFYAVVWFGARWVGVNPCPPLLVRGGGACTYYTYRGRKTKREERSGRIWGWSGDPKKTTACKKDMQNKK
jgi:hypothetical protein